MSRSTTSPRSCQLTVKPLNAWNLSKFKAHPVQLQEYSGTKLIFRDGFPAHQAMFYDGKKSVLACGLIDMSGGQYYVWTLFGDGFTKRHFRHVINYFENYLNVLDYRSIHHIVKKEMPWTKKMMRLSGFSYVRDECELTEHWVRL